MDTRVKTGVALLSGGLDSSIALCLAQRYDRDITLALTFDYGQRAAGAEIRAARKIADYFKIPHRVVEVPYFKGLTFSGALLKEAWLPTPTLTQLSESQFTKESASAVWVPNRNGVFIEIAAAIAEDLKAASLVVGFNREEAETFPDNSIEYLAAITHALSFSTANQVEVLSPTAGFTKTQIVEQGIQEGFPFAFLWSCYEDGQKMCGRCESCMRLKRALNANEVRLDDLFENSHL